jgi:aspartyl-tRNA(Asn)/glutamyl-tRNA(Gln) amidotransferase subunit B
VAEYGLSPYDAGLLVEERGVADYFEQAVQAQPARARSPKAVANWMTGELFRLMNETAEDIGAVRLPPAQLAALTGLVGAGTLNLNTAKAVLETMYRTGRTAAEIVAEQGLAQVSDLDTIGELVASVLAAHPAELSSYLSGKDAVEQWFFGQVMRRLKGQGNPQVIRQALSAALARHKQKV